MARSVSTFNDLLAIGMDQTIQLRVGERVLVKDEAAAYEYLGGPSYSPDRWERTSFPMPDADPVDRAAVLGR